MTAAQQTMTGGDVFTPEQAADYLQVSTLTVYRQLRTGQLPGMKVGRQWRLSRQALDDLMAQGKAAS